MVYTSKGGRKISVGQRRCEECRLPFVFGVAVSNLVFPQPRHPTLVGLSPIPTHHLTSLGMTPDRLAKRAAAAASSASPCPS